MLENGVELRLCTVAAYNWTDNVYELLSINPTPRAYSEVTLKKEKQKV